MFMGQKMEQCVATREEKLRVDQQESPAFILKLDEKLSVYHANPVFYTLLGTCSEEFPTLYENRFCNVLTFHHQFQQLRDIHEAMKQGCSYWANVEVLTATGQVRNLYFKAQRKVIAGLGEMLVGIFHGIQEEKPCFV